jgi:hypothetical protein
MLTLGLAEAEERIPRNSRRLNEASDDVQREQLRKFMETKGAKARVNPKAFPKR